MAWTLLSCYITLTGQADGDSIIMETITVRTNKQQTIALNYDLSRSFTLFLRVLV